MEACKFVRAPQAVAEAQGAAEACKSVRAPQAVVAALSVAEAPRKPEPERKPEAAPQAASVAVEHTEDIRLQGIRKHQASAESPVQAAGTL